MINKAEKLRELATIRNDRSLLDSGIETIRAADILLDESRASFLTTSAKISLGTMGHAVYSEGVEICFVKQKQEAEAFRFIEKDIGLVLLEALHSGRRIQDVMVPDSLSGPFQRISCEIAEFTAEQNHFKEDDK